MKRAHLTRLAKAFVPAIAALTLAACGAQEEKKTYEADMEDKSGGDLIVTEANPDAVPVELPETPMTPVPPEETPTKSAEPTGTPAQ